VGQEQRFAEANADLLQSGGKWHIGCPRPKPAYRHDGHDHADECNGCKQPLA
jgi:hypothetical protein